MLWEVREYFRNAPVSRHKCSVRTGTQLARSGITDMDALCRLLEREPERLRSLRNIGPKSMELICEVCAAYQNERGDALSIETHQRK